MKTSKKSCRRSASFQGGLTIHSSRRRFAVGLNSGVILMGLTDIEEEVVFLKAIKEMIDSMVNFAMLSLQGSDPDASVLFKTSMHQRLFNILLVDL